MANTYKNIVITPNKGSSTVDPTIVFSGANTTVNTDITLRVYPTSNGTLSFEGSAGQLFSITNDLTGTLFSVNDISGMPSIEVDANGKITLAQYSGNVGIGTGSPTYKLDVAGDMRVTGNVIMGDASTDTITLNGSIISLGNNQSIDSGTLFVDATNNKVGIGTTSPTSNLHVIGTANITSSVVIGADMFTENVKFNGGSTVRAYSTLLSNSFIITNGATTNKYALQVESGAGTGGIYVYRSSSNYSIGDSGSVLDIRSTNWGGVSFVATGSIAFAANNGIFRFSGDTTSYNASNGVIQVIANANVGYYIRFTKDGLTTTSNLRANDVFTVAYDGTVNTKSNVEAVFFKGNGSLLTGITTDFSPAFIQANTARDHANAAFANANTTHTLTIAAFGAANASFANGNTNFTTLQTVFGVANAGFLAANSAFANANGTHTLTVASFGAANASFANGNTNFTTLQTLFGVANAAFANANTTHTLTIAAFGAANASFLASNSKTNLLGRDIRTIYPANTTNGYVEVGFTTWNNDASTPYADFVHLRTYTDVSGGSDNLLTFRKDAIGMRLWQHSYFATTPYAAYKDVAFTSDLSTGNAAIIQANTARDHANAAFANANTTHTLTIAAFAAANASFANANTTHTLSIASFSAANASFANGNTNFTVLQTVFGAANASFANANTTHTLTIEAYAAANASFANGNTNFTTLQTVFGVANASFANGNTNFTVLQTVFGAANAAFANANSTHTLTISAFAAANASFANANSTHTLTIASFDAANAAFSAANASFANGNTNFTTLQTVFGVSNAAFSNANTTHTLAIAAFTQANTANNLTVANTGTVVGSRNVLNFIPGGNVTISFADDAVGNRVNVTIAATGSSGGGGLSYTSNVGNNSANTFNITHALNSTTIIPAVREIASGYYVYPDMKVTSPNNIVLEFVSVPTANQYFLILLGA